MLNANYVKRAACAPDALPFGDRPCMHEALFDDALLEGTGVTTLDFAKAMIDEGFHPMTMYFPLVVHGAMLIEPTESEPKQTLDRFVTTLRQLAEAARAGDIGRFKEAPRLAPGRRLDETEAAREPKLRWKPRLHQERGCRIAVGSDPDQETRGCDGCPLRPWVWGRQSPRPQERRRRIR